ncbi:MAG: DUF4270 family protein [Saprospiraceae bacterium]
MKQNLLALVVLVIAVLLTPACNEPTLVGADLLEQDQASVEFTDTLTLRTKAITEDSILIFDLSQAVNPSSYLCGKFIDPVFGKMDARLFLQFFLGTESPSFVDLDPSEIMIDSVVLAMAYSFDDMIGDQTIPQSLEVYELSEPMDYFAKYYSSQTFMNNGVVIGSINDLVVSNETDSMVVLNYPVLGAEDADTLTFAPHLRIPIDNSFAEKVMSLGATAYANDTSFVDAFYGLEVKIPDAVVHNNLIMSFALSNSTSRMIVYYRDTTDPLLKKQFNYTLAGTSAKVINLKNDYVGTFVADYIDNQVLGEQYAFVQGLAGLNTELHFPTARNFSNIVVNKAELEFTVAELSIDDPVLYSPIEQIYALDRDEDGDLGTTEDLAFALRRGNLSLFGGSVKEEVVDGVTLKTYRMNISGQFQEIIDGGADPLIVLRGFPKQESAARVVLFGPGHDKYPAKLKLTYTFLD